MYCYYCEIMYHEFNFYAMLVLKVLHCWFLKKKKFYVVGIYCNLSMSVSLEIIIIKVKHF